MSEAPERPILCGSCGWRGDGGYVQGREHLDECPTRADAEARGFKRCWGIAGFGPEVAWTRLDGYLTRAWHAFPEPPRKLDRLPQPPADVAQLARDVLAVLGDINFGLLPPEFLISRLQATEAICRAAIHQKENT